MVIRSIAMSIAAASMFSAPVQAELLRVEIKTVGLECDSCARAISGAMQKVEGIQSVGIGVKEGLIVLELRQHNRVTLSELRRAIKNSGLVSKDALVIARGSLTGDYFEVGGTREHVRVKGQLAKLVEHGRWLLTAVAP